MINSAPRSLAGNMRAHNSSRFHSHAGRCNCEKDSTRQSMDVASIYRKHYRNVFAWCFRIVHNKEDAEDLTQETFIHVMRGIHNFRGDANLSTWLFRVTKNTVFMHLRRKRLRFTTFNEVNEASRKAQRQNASQRDLSTKGHDSMSRIDLERAVDQLPRGYRTAFLLHDVEDYDHAEIAQITCRSIGTSKSELHKARRRLRLLLGSSYGCFGLPSTEDTSQEPSSEEI